MSDDGIDLTKLLGAVRRLKRAEAELYRAERSGEQPRLSKAGTSYHMAKFNLFNVAGLLKEQRRPAR